MTQTQNSVSSFTRPIGPGSVFSSWQLMIATLLLAGVGIAPSLLLIWPKWTGSYTYSHGIPIVVLCGWLIWRQKSLINSIEVRPIPITGVAFLGLLMASTLAYAASIETATELLMPVTLLCAVLFVAGSKIANKVAFPLLLLYSAISIWGVINSTLQSWTTVAVTAILNILQVPNFIQGDFVRIPSGVFEIAGGCSGLHFLIVGLTLAAIYGHLYLRTWTRQLQLLAVMGAMSIVMNWIRVATIITAGHMTDMQSYLVKVDHYNFGWILFVVMLVPFFFIAHRIEGVDKQAVPRVDSPALPERERAVATGLTQLILIGVVVLLSIFVWGRIMLHSGRFVEIEAPVMAGVQGPNDYQGNWNPVFPGAHAEVMASYCVPGACVDAYVNWFDGQSQGQELIGYLADVSGKKLRAEYDRALIDSTRENNGDSREIREIIAVENNRQRRIIQYYYVIGDEMVVDPVEAKMRQAMRSMFGYFGSGLVAWSMLCDTGDSHCASARRNMYAAIESTETDLYKIILSLNASNKTPSESREVEE